MSLKHKLSVRPQNRNRKFKSLLNQNTADNPSGVFVPEWREGDAEAPCHGGFCVFVLEVVNVLGGSGKPWLKELSKHAEYQWALSLPSLTLPHCPVHCRHYCSTLIKDWNELHFFTESLTTVILLHPHSNTLSLQTDLEMLTVEGIFFKKT